MAQWSPARPQAWQWALKEIGTLGECLPGVFKAPGLGKKRKEGKSSAGRRKGGREGEEGGKEEGGRERER